MKVPPIRIPPGNPCEREGCDNHATISVGANGQWHLCELCAVRAEFQRYRRRVPLRKQA